MEFEKKKNSTRNHLGKPDKKITDSVLRQLKEHEKILKNKFWLYCYHSIPRIITTHADPTAIADRATAALAVSFACLASSLLSPDISSTTRSIAVFIHSIALIKTPPMINSDRSAVDKGSAIAAAKELTFATTHCYTLFSVIKTCKKPFQDHIALCLVWLTILRHIVVSPKLQLICKPF